MRKTDLGNIVLSVAVVLIIISGASIWFKLFETAVSTAMFVIALILIGAGAGIIKKKNLNQHRNRQ